MREAEPTHVLGHVSDSHCTASGLLHGRVRPAEQLRDAAARLAGSGIPFDAIVHTGDIADTGEAEAYAAADAAVRDGLGDETVPVVWVPGNHDVREPMRTVLLAGADTPAAGPLDQVHDVGGLRIVVLDSSVPGRVDGELDDAQLDRLREVLRVPAGHGTVLALHHPPVPIEVTLLQRFPLARHDRLAEAIDGTDVRAILAGHLHHTTMSTLAGVPVLVAPATAYTVEIGARGGGLRGVDGGRAVGVLSLYGASAEAPARIGYSLLPVAQSPVVASLDEDHFDRHPVS